MNKKLGMTLVAVGAIVLAGCGPTSSESSVSSSQSSSSQAVDPALAKLQAAFDSLGGLLADPTNITTGFQVPVTLANNVTATWSSAQPGVLSFSTTPTNGLLNVTVNRPAKGAGDANFNIFADLSIAAELTAGNLTRRWTQGVTVKQSTVDVVAINNIADILALRDPALDRTLNVTLQNMTIFAKSSGVAFAFDGTGIIQIFLGAADTLVVGQVYTISGLIDWYFGIWEIVESTASLQANATPLMPNKEVINQVLAKINRLTGEGAHLSAGLTAAAGNFEPIYARITGRVAIFPSVSDARYNTYIMDVNTPDGSFVAGTESLPANGLMLYYQTDNFELIRSYVGIEVTIDVVIYTYRSNNRAFAIYYVGGTNGITAKLSDLQSQTVDAASLSLPTSITEAITLTLPLSGANGTTITWSSNKNEVINPSSGLVTIPTPAVSVTLTASVSKGSETPTVRTFVINVGAPQAINLSALETLAFGSVAKTDVKVIWKNPSTSPSLLNRAFIVADATGYAYLVNDVALPDLKVNDYVAMTYEVASFSGYTQMTKVRISQATGTAPTSLASPTVWTSTEAQNYLALSRFGIRYVTINDLIGFKSGNFLDAYLAGFGVTNTVRTDGAPATLENMKFNATGFILGRGSNFITFNNDASNYSTGVAATDAEKLAISVERFVAPPANNEVTGNITLPATPAFGSVTWSSNMPSVISNTGIVTRPEPGQPDVTVKLSYVITVGTLSSQAVEITFVVKAGEPIVTLYSADFGLAGRSGYGEGMIYQDSVANNTWANLLTTNNAWDPAVNKVNKNRVQIAAPTGIHNTGAFLVFSPIVGALVAYMEFDLSSINNPGKFAFSYAIWSGADASNFTDPTKVTSAVLSMEKFDGTNWVPLASTLDLIANASATEYKTSSFTLTGAAKYRLVYTLVVPSGNTNTGQNQRLTVDSVIVTNR